MCTPATAATEAIVEGRIAGAASSLAFLTGVYGNDELRVRVGRAISRVVDDSRELSGAEPQRLVPPRTLRPNLVSNLADVIRDQDDRLEAGILPGVLGDGAESVPEAGEFSIDAVGGAVRQRFVPLRLRLLVDEADPAVTTVTGALLMGYVLADAPITSLAREFPFDWPQRVAILRPPWQVSHPLLLDPVLWMFGTALMLVSDS